MKYNIKVTNKDTRTIWYHSDLSKDEIGHIQCNPNLVIEIQSENSEGQYRSRKQWGETKDEE